MSDGNGMMLMPAAPGTCAICAVDHTPAMPHNQQSLFYQYRFFAEHGRWPTWADALAHCDERVREHWKRELERGGHWSEPEAGAPIADAYRESDGKPVRFHEHADSGEGGTA